VINCEGFMFTPTDCEPQEFAGTATSAQGAVAAISSHFEVGSCRALACHPKFSVFTGARPSRAESASLTAKLPYPTAAQRHPDERRAGQSRTAEQLPPRLTTLHKACSAVQFEANPAGCPAASIVGHTIVHTPLLPVPLSGPAYFVSHGGEAFPSLTIGPPGLRHDREPRRQPSHQQARSHEHHIQDGVRCALRHLRIDAPEGAVLGTHGVSAGARQRQPLRADADAADRIFSPKTAPSSGRP
jgi:hypothetical protein